MKVLWLDLLDNGDWRDEDKGKGGLYIVFSISVFTVVDLSVRATRYMF